MRISAVVAITPSWGIGMNGTLPWSNTGIHLKNDLMYFKNMTSYVDDKTKMNAVIMGRKTWEGIPIKNRPLKNRLNIVITSNKEWASINLPEGTLSASSFEESLSLIKNNDTIENAVVIGGAALFEESAFHSCCDTYHITKIEQDFESDTFLSEKTKNLFCGIEPISVSETLEEMGVKYKMYVYNPSISNSDSL